MSAPTRSPRSRRGFTLAELMVAMAIFGVIMTSAFGFLLAQGKSFRALAAKAAATQNGRFGRDIMRQELRTAGTNVTDRQPMLVYAGDSVVAFNSDLTTNRLDSARFTGAVYVDVNATNSEVNAMSLGDAIAIPGSSPAFMYPLADYSNVAGTAGEAETITFRFTRDTSSTDPLDRMLLRQVNGGTAEIIATGLRKSLNTPFFRYWYDPSVFNTNLTDLDTVPRAWVPLSKSAAQRGLTPDTGTAISARIDQVRGVEVTYEASAPIGNTRNVVRYIVPMPNTAVSRQSRACGRTPLAPSSPSGVWRADSSAVLVSWSRATDDGAGEKDVVRYVLFRRLAGATTWGEPVGTVSALGGTLSYTYKDGGVQTGSFKQYQYGLAVQDCTPNLSSVSISGVVIVP